MARATATAVLFALVLAATSDSLAEETPKGYTAVPTGCEKKLHAVCPDWKTSKATCLACVSSNLPKLEPNCTLAQAKKKCHNGGSGPSPAPSGPLPVGPAALPPTAPTAGAPRPHIILFVVDDMGWAAMGYHNPGNVYTPNFDAEAKAGVILDRHYSFRWCAPTRSGE